MATPFNLIFLYFSKLLHLRLRYSSKAPVTIKDGLSAQIFSVCFYQKLETASRL